ncbi:uncharacterized protein LOC130300134 [Hyla sarda]|uniref:uncharacterized protein LOC130300134 n=1 Tax=Hyla sarda TaxID=327740 RepID=UPI0024C3EF32|nr:uncharacterized protein LOC130300134 [Hyla sarda]
MRNNCLSSSSSPASCGPCLGLHCIPDFFVCRDSGEILQGSHPEQASSLTGRVEPEGFSENLSSVWHSPGGIIFHQTEQGHQEDQGGQGKSDSDCPLLAPEGMVVLPKDHVSIGPVGPSRSPGHPDTGSAATSRSVKSTPDGLVLERIILKANGLSEAVIDTVQASRKTVTTKRKFFEVVGLSNIDFDKANRAAILDFLQKDLEKGLRATTLMLHLSALGALFSQKIADHLDPKIF